MLKTICTLALAISICFNCSVVFATGILTLPFKSNPVKGYGYAGYTGHKGTDWFCDIGTPVVACADGVVTIHDAGVPNKLPT
jgi:murein DD-endopeptidase MepM/ murein hydrolase activator NlpD